MDKIMFDDNLTPSVLDGSKPLTRRIIPGQDKIPFEEFEKIAHTDYVLSKSRYKVGDVVAIAQSYKAVLAGISDIEAQKAYRRELLARKPLMYERIEQMPAWDNKMYVCADLMPHLIRITNLKVERLQDISPQDALLEGVQKWLDGYIVSGLMARGGQHNKCFDTPVQAFAALIDKLSGAGTWKKNPYVFAYTFELIKPDITQSGLWRPECMSFVYKQ
jgi:hypothetical protein